jgi:hypothetical protein
MWELTEFVSMCGPCMRSAIIPLAVILPLYLGNTWAVWLWARWMDVSQTQTCAYEKVFGVRLFQAHELKACNPRRDNANVREFSVRDR